MAWAYIRAARETEGPDAWDIAKRNFLSKGKPIPARRERRDAARIHWANERHAGARNLCSARFADALVRERTSTWPAASAM